jgi:hypothetical protein
MFLDEIDEAAIDDYRDKRKREPVTKHKKPIKGTRIAYSTVNRELAILRMLLRLAKRKKRMKIVPELNLESEKPLKRSRVISVEEYRAVLDNLARRWQRPIIRTAMRVNVLLNSNGIGSREGGINSTAGRRRERESTPARSYFASAAGCALGTESRAEAR